MFQTLLIELAAFCVGLCAASFGEWTLHRFLMHGPRFPWHYPYRQHQLVHHEIFGFEEDYLLHRKEDAEFITFAWWNVPILMAVLAGIVYAVRWATGLPIFWGAFASMALYYSLYEFLHYHMHVPKGRWFQRAWWFRWINRHHWLHHRQMLKNLNVVLPLADFVLGTRVASTDYPPGDPVAHPA